MRGGRLGIKQEMRSVSEQNEDGIEAQNRLRMELVAAMEAEEEAGKRWHDLLFATIYREREPADPDQPFALAVALSEEGSSLAERVPPAVVDMAKTYVEAVTRRQEVWATLQAGVAYSHPKHLDELNRERSLEEMERLLEDLRGYEDPPENP